MEKDVQIELEVGVVLGVGVDVGDGFAPTKLQEPVSTPTDSGAKKENRPAEKSSPKYGQPGHCNILY